MLDRVKELLARHGITKSEPRPITNGASGASLYNIDDQYIVKYARKPENETKIYNMFVKEYKFYNTFSNKDYDFIPNVAFQTTKDDETFIVMQKYVPVSHGEWNSDLFKRAMRLCAHINALDMSALNMDVPENGKIGDDYDTYPLSESYENWLALRRRFPERLDVSLLNAMYKDFDALRINAERLPIPITVCHGDFHPENFLWDGDKLILCDWQTVGLGKGASDVAFFISRGTDMGIPVNRNDLIEEYHKAIMETTDIKIELSDLYKNVAATDFYVSFKFWAQYLQNSGIERILSIYNSMINSYNILQS